MLEEFTCFDGIEYLEYLGTLKDRNRTWYKFRRGHIFETVFEESAIELVNTYPVNQRNCKISKGKISFKSGFGNNVIEKEGRKVIKMVTAKHYKGVPDMWDIDAGLEKIVQDTNFMKVNEDLVRYFDNVNSFDYNTMTFRTSQGHKSIHDISSSLKMLLNVKYIRKLGVDACVDISDCDLNILPFVFEAVYNTPIVLYTSGCYCYHNDGFVYNINGVETTNLLDLMFKFKD